MKKNKPAKRSTKSKAAPQKATAKPKSSKNKIGNILSLSWLKKLVKK